jgi:hypothetical protein
LSKGVVYAVLLIKDMININSLERLFRLRTRKIPLKMSLINSLILGSFADTLSCLHDLS